MPHLVRTAGEGGTRWLRAIAQPSTLLGIVLVGLLWLGLNAHLDDRHNSAERAAIQNTNNLTRAFEEHLSRTLKDIDRSLRIARARYLRSPNIAEFVSWLRGSELFDDATLQFVIIGPDGFLEFSSLAPLSTRMDLSDREHFRVHVNAKIDELFISKPVLGRLSGKWTVQLARRIERADGTFGGVILAGFDPTRLSHLYESVDVGRGGYVSIIGVDGIVRATSGHAPAPLGADMSKTPLFQHYPKTPSGWFYTADDRGEGTTRLTAYRAVHGYPLVVLVGLSNGDIFAGLHADQRRYYSVAALLTLLVLAVIGFGIRSRRARERIADDLERQNIRLNALLANMPVGVSMFDRSHRLAIWNDRYCRMYGLPQAVATLGTPLREINRFRQAHRTFSTEEEEEFYEGLADRLHEGLLLERTFRLDDGRSIAVRHQPLHGGGWISIHEDITAQQLAQARLEQTKQFLDTVIENVPTSIAVKDPDTRKFVLVNRAYEGFMGLPRDQLVGKTAFDLFSSQDAEAITRLDSEALQFNKHLIGADFAVETPANGRRVVNTTRLLVSDGSAKTRYLIVVIEDVTARRKSEEQIAYLAHHDALTSLLNRVKFVERLDKMLARIPHGGQLVLLYLDLDRFKEVNDTLGHHVGDDLLREVAGRLSRCVRDTAVVARLGGDEFAVADAAIDHPADTSALAERICATIRAPYDLGGHQVVVGASIGVACAPKDATTSAELMKQADMALYKTKAEGRNGYRFFNPEMGERANARRKLESELRDAINRGEFTLFYQPVINIKLNKITGLEALVRWDHPKRGLVLPGEFIPISEDTGLIVPLGEWVLRQACSDAAKWPSHLKIAVNLSPTQFRSEGLASVVVGALAAAGISPRRLELEITEEMFFERNRDNLAVLERLRGLGVQIVMDDFGIGYSSLNYLRSFPFDRIKIDKSFVHDLSSGNELSLAIVQAVARLAGVLRVPATAEGVETAEQLELIRAAGCTEFQGNLFSAPKAAGELTEFFPMSEPVLPPDVPYLPAVATKGRRR
jgi:diguanylate cyclase (GGDEF)-like protein/PAS domain S-box-containing protein